MADPTLAPSVPSREPFGWVLIPLALIAYGCAFFFAFGAIIGIATSASALSSDRPVTVALHGQTELGKAPGTHSYSGGPYIADDAVVTATSATANVSGVDGPARLALRLGPTLWAGTIAVVATALGLAVTRIGARDAGWKVARPIAIAAAALAIGSTLAQAVTAFGTMRLGHIAWIGPDGINGFTAIPDTVFDLTPLGVAAALLTVVIAVRRADVDPSR